MPDILSSIGSSLGPATAALGVVKSGIEYFSEKKKDKEAKAELDRLNPAFYKIQDEYFKNQNLAEGVAQGGLGQDTLDYYTTESQRGLGAGISGILQSGGNPNDIAHLFDTYDRGINKVASENAQQHLENIKYLQGVNKDLAGQKTIANVVNEIQPYQNKLKEITERRAAAQTNQHNALNDAISSLGAFGTSLQNSGLGKGNKANFGAGGNTMTNGGGDVANRVGGAATEVVAENGLNQPNNASFQDIDWDTIFRRKI